MTNQALNSATPANQKLSSAGLTWDEADFTWDEASGTWNNPYSFINETQNTGTLTNQAKS
jgi:hypothetical protein